MHETTVGQPGRPSNDRPLREVFVGGRSGRPAGSDRLLVRRPRDGETLRDLDEPDELGSMAVRVDTPMFAREAREHRERHRTAMLRLSHQHPEARDGGGETKICTRRRSATRPDGDVERRTGLGVRLFVPEVHRRPLVS